MRSRSNRLPRDAAQCGGRDWILDPGTQVRACPSLPRRPRPICIAGFPRACPLLYPRSLHGRSGGEPEAMLG